MAKALDKRALWKTIEREQRARERAELAELARVAREERKKRGPAVRAARGACKAGKQIARERAKVVRLEGIERARAEARAVKASARATCATELEQAKAPAARARAELVAQKSHRRELRGIERTNRRRRHAAPKVSARTKREESDDEVRQNMPPELLGLFERVKRQIHGDARRSRTEAFLEYVEAHPGEELDAIEDETDRVIAELERRQARANPGEPARLGAPDPRRGPLTELGALVAVHVDRGAGPRRVAMRRPYPRLCETKDRGLVVMYEQPGKRSSAPRTARERAAVRRYEDTHWGERGRARVRTLAAPDPREVLEQRGDLVAISYLTKKRGDEELAEYTHRFAKRPKLLATRDRGLVIAGGKYGVTYRGIVG